MKLDNQGENWPQRSTPEKETVVLRAALHAMARSIIGRRLRDLPNHCFDEEQALVDYFIAKESEEELG